MRTVLHIITRQQDPLAEQIIEKQRGLAETQINVTKLPETGADYEALLDQIFAADSVEVW